MSGFFQNILPPPPPPSPLGKCVPFGTGGGHTRCVERGWGVNMLEDARHCSVLYIRKYFVLLCQRFSVGEEVRSASSLVVYSKVLNFLYFYVGFVSKKHFCIVLTSVSFLTSLDLY